MSIGVDFDFPRYIAERHGQNEQRARDGAAYAYSGERKMRRTLSSARPVTLALEATTRLWRDVAKAELLGSAVKSTDQQFPRLYEAARNAAEMLRMRPPPVYVAPSSWSVTARALGTDDSPYIVVNAEVAKALSDKELVAVIGHELGHLQNNQVLYATALHYLTQSAVFFVRWIVQPAIMLLQAWSRRAEITCDRAALLASRDLRATLGAMVKLELGVDAGAAVNLDEYLAQKADPARGLGRFTEIFRAHPYLPKRVQALQRFADSAFYANVIGETAAGRPSADDVDSEVGKLLAIF